MRDHNKERVMREAAKLGTPVRAIVFGVLGVSQRDWAESKGFFQSDVSYVLSNQRKMPRIRLELSKDLGVPLGALNEIIEIGARKNGNRN